MLSSPRKPPANRFLPVRVLPVHPPGEVEQQLVERALEEEPVALPLGPGHLVHPPAGPGVHRRVDVAEGELVGRDLAVGMHVPLAQQQQELLLGEVGIDAGKRDHVEGQVPGGEPGVLPLVGHRDDVAVEQVRPVGVAALGAAGRRRGLRRIALEPVLDDVVVELLAPEQAGVALPEHPPLVLRRGLRQALAVELVGLADRARRSTCSKPAPNGLRGLALGRGAGDGRRARRPAGTSEDVVDGGLGAHPGGLTAPASPCDHVRVKGVLHVGLRVGRTEEPLERWSRSR